GNASGHLLQVRKAMLMQDAGGDGRAIASRTMHRDTAIARKIGYALRQMIERNVEAAGDVLRLPLASGTDVKNKRRLRGAQFLSDIYGSDTLRRPDEIGAVCERRHSAFKIAIH